MRDMHIQAIERKIRRIRTYKLIGKMLFWTTVIILVISLFSMLNTILVNQSDEAIRARDILDKLNMIDQSIEENRSTGQIESLGTFTVTHYCDCKICTGDGDGITATGTTATEGRTIAVTKDSVIPLGGKVVIDGEEYIAEDLMAGTGNKVDIFVSDHKTAIQRGRFTREVQYEK